jgi:ribosomal protein S18 acetylase RimI-like enzyme
MGDKPGCETLRMREHFYRINAAWLERYFQLEPIDVRVLREPEASVLAGGGAILFALLGASVVGTCALLREAPGVYELSKMGVVEAFQGRGIGKRLLQAAIDDFHRRDGHTLFLESSSRLAAALRMYRAAGFELQRGIREGSHYRRADVYMVYSPTASIAA